MYPDPIKLTDAERQWNDVLRFENHEIYTRMSRDFHREFDTQGVDMGREGDKQ